ncbi:hypothetical protein Tco_0542737 [Tanacetum coccineum]
MTKDRILKDYWRERFSDDHDDIDRPVKTSDSVEDEDPEKCGEDRTNIIIGVVLGKLDDAWFKGTSEDEDDLEGISTVGLGERYTKVKVLGIDEMPRTRENVATMRAGLMVEMGTSSRSKGTDFKVPSTHNHVVCLVILGDKSFAQVILDGSSLLAKTSQDAEQCSGESLVLILLLKKTSIEQETWEMDEKIKQGQIPKTYYGVNTPQELRRNLLKSGMVIIEVKT